MVKGTMSGCVASSSHLQHLLEKPSQAQKPAREGLGWSAKDVMVLMECVASSGELVACPLL